MKHLTRLLYECSPWGPFLSAWLAGYVVVGGDGGVYRTEAGDEYLDKFTGSGHMNIGNNSKEQLKSIVERVERLEEEKKTLSDDIRDVYAEAKGNGYDVKALRAIVRLRKQDADKRAEHEAILETYMHALGMLADLPLGQAAIERAVA